MVENNSSENKKAQEELEDSKVVDKKESSEEMSRVTRYFCAAAHLNSDFRKQFINQIVNEKWKSIPPYYGVDLLAVAKHCFMARKRKIIRDILLFVIFLLTFKFAFGGFRTIGLMLQYETFFIPNPGALFLFYMISLVIVFLEQWKGKYKIVARKLSEKNLSSVEYQMDKDIENKINSISEKESNVIIFGGYSPFVGAGIDIGGWSFAINTNKGKEEVGKICEPKTFEANEMYKFISEKLEKIQIGKVVIKDILCVNGQELREDTRFLANPYTKPYNRVEQEIIEKYIGIADENIRHYECIRIHSWKDELILSIFFRITKINQNLFIETRFFLLTPLNDLYSQIDNILAYPTFKIRMAELQASAFISIFLLAFSPFIIASYIFSPLSRWSSNRAIRKLIKNNLNFNYGAITNLRESQSSAVYKKYFQKLDKDMHMKIFEKQLLDYIVQFLDSKNIDTSELKERQTTILNNGVILSGGAIKTESFAVGEKAKSVFKRFGSGMRTPKQSKNKED